MQSGFPESDPRLQRTNLGPKVGAGYVDPGIVVLETTLKGEIPLLIICWAASIQEIRTTANQSRLQLQDVVALQCLHESKGFGRNSWTFQSRIEPSLLLKQKHDGPIRLPLFDSITLKHPFDSRPITFEGIVHFIDQETDASLRATLAKESGVAPRFIRHLLKSTQTDWQSIEDILASLEPRKKKSQKKDKPSLVQRLTSLFKKKSQLVPA